MTNWGKVGAIAGIASVIVAVIAIWVARPGVIDPAPPNNSLTSPSSVNSSAPSTDPGPTAETRNPTPITIRHHGMLKLVGSGNQAIDLDAPSDNPQWSSKTAAEDISFSYDGKLIFNTIYAKAASIGATPANYQNCRNAPGLSDATIKISSLAAGQYMCIETSEHRFAALKIIDITTDPTITFEVVVYDPPDST